MQRLITHQNPEGKETPLLLLAALREIDPTVELAYAGTNIWWLGAVMDNAERRKRAENMMKQLRDLEREYQSPRTMMLCALNLQGFALIEAYHGPEVSGTVVVNPGPNEYHTTILEDFRWRDAEWRRDQGKSHVEQRMLETLGEPQRIEREAQAREYLANDGRDQYRRIVKGRVQFGHGGMTGGSNALIHLP
jgi:hypothetical protein